MIPFQDSCSVFRHCIDPIAPDVFFSEYWEQQPLLVKRAAPTHFDGLLSFRDVDRIVACSGLQYPGFRIVKDGAQGEHVQDLLENRYASPTSQIGDPTKILDALADGHTLILQALERNWIPLGSFCRALKSYLNVPVQANAYLTPAEAQGFIAHYDTHVLFVIQSGGSKRWRVWGSPFPLPLKTQKSNRRQDIIDGEAKQAPAIDVVLEPGDTLFIPRGFVHAARTSHAPSLHLTVGIFTRRILEIAAEHAEVACKELMQSDSNAAVYLPQKSCGTAEIPEYAAEMFTRIVECLFSRLSPYAAIESQFREFLVDRKPSLRGRLVCVQQCSAIEPDQVLYRRTNVTWKTVLNDTSVRIYFDGGSVDFQREAASILEWIAAQERLSAHNLPEQSGQIDRLNLLKQLVECGLLATSSDE